MEFTSVEQVRREFAIEETDKESIISRLKQLLKESHPDKVEDGSFVYEKYDKVNKALEYMDKAGNEVVPVKCVTDLVQVIKDLTVKEQERSAERVLSECLDRNYRKQKEALFVPKVSLTAVSGALTFLWFSPQYVLEHPIMSKIIVDELIFSSLWFSVTICVGILWILVFKNDKRNKNLLDDLKTEYTQNEILMDFCRYQCGRGAFFAKSELTDYILRRFNRYGSFNRVGIESPLMLNKIPTIFKSGINRESAECIADSIIEKAEKKGMIRYKSDDRSFVDHYEWLLTEEDYYRD